MSLTSASPRLRTYGRDAANQHFGPFAVDGAALDVIGASNHAVRTLRPNRCSRTSHAAFHVWMTGAFSSIFWVLRSGVPWRDLPENYKPPGTGLKRFLHMDAHRAPATTQNDVAYVDTSSCQRSHQGEAGRPAPSSARYQESCICAILTRSATDFAPIFS
jgi:hypothetical protein